MASGPIMLVPMCLVENKNEQFSVNQKALKILNKISQPVVVVAIVGLYRTGKSYLMNCLAREKLGFPLGSTVQSETKGIWMWCVPHPSKPSHTLVLLDTEGLGDVEKGDPKNDSWIFALAVLLSSMFVYNSMNTINHDALEKLHYVAELTELIRAKSSPVSNGVEDSTEFVSFFPDFIWTVRDFTLELKLNGRPITEDEYLENALKLIPGVNPKLKNSNILRECIRHFFPKRKCFVFDRPTNDKELLAHVEDILESQLDPKFRKQSDNFCSYIYTHAKTKTLREGVKVTGNRLGPLVVTYVDTILQTDKALTQREKALAAEQAMKEAAEKEQAWLRQKYQEQQQQIEAQHRSIQENIVQLREKLEREREDVLREQTRILEHKIKIQEDLLNEGFKKKSEEMEAEINRLRNLIETTEKEKTPWISRTLDHLATEASAILSVPAKLVDKGLRWLGSLFK
ncbi:hypothetical protein mRhiFer1_005564 [Rhinolophus ferrumequinum]|uniref:GB1/RHD3-type G domain-containing protein n=1 Tax=Rhinolophus ferrumequinum TaxID=59479 RepID=A0A7J7X4I4_RHIFE|nr:hypothetical protein mRhiFer1_005564 [Rhinolophus ferrumequinum]